MNSKVNLFATAYNKISREDLMDAEVKTEPALKLNFLSHGTLESKDLERSRKFFEEFFGCDVIRTSPISLLIRLMVPENTSIGR